MREQMMSKVHALDTALAHLRGSPDPLAADAASVLTQMRDAERKAEADLARPDTHRVVGMYLGQPDELEERSLEEAIGAAYWAVEDNTFLPERIETLDGTEVLEGHALTEALADYGRRQSR